MSCTNDTPVSNRELDQFYGVEVSPAEFEQARAINAAAYDADDLRNDAYDIAPMLNKLLVANNIAAAGSLLAAIRKNTIERRAEFCLFGKVITPLFEVTA